jgi:glycogen operon protein
MQTDDRNDRRREDQAMSRARRRRRMTRSGIAVAIIVAVAATAHGMLGARYDSNRTHVDFAVYSSHATRIELCLYEKPAGTPAAARLEMAKDSATNVWSKRVSLSELSTAHGITGTVYYGYRAWGPNWPFDPSWTEGSGIGFVADVDGDGNRFNPNKLLFDPYALESSHDPIAPGRTDGTVYASGPSHRNADSGPNAPKGIVLMPDDTGLGSKPTRALKDDVIYEVHVRGLTMNDPTIPAPRRGTYSGAGLKARALRELGVTAVEFLPVQETQNDANDVDPNGTGGDNYWGYATLGYFAPDRRYSSDKKPGGPTREWKAMVAAFHDQGIKVFVDVVYNHTGEGGAWSAGDPSTMNVLSFRGLDNPVYYSLTSDKRFGWDNTGVGGNYNTVNAAAQQLIVDSLRYWRDALGVDGFRFDLASVLGNTCEHGCFRYDKLDPRTALNRIARDLAPRPATGGPGTDYIAEPWAIGEGTYQVGNFPGGWAEWNGIYRDTLRKYQNKLGVETVTPGDLAMRFAGSADLYQDDGRKPGSSIDFIVAHDGFTLKDLYSCNTKNNAQPWPSGPSDGGEDNNNSWDHGGIAADGRKAARNGVAFVMLSAGTPMITGGDEFLRSLGCNNNPYNLDSIKNWLDYAWTPDQSTFRTFAQRLIAFRKSHAALRPADFYGGSDANGNGLEQLRWFKPDGGVADGGYFADRDNHAIAYRIDGTELGDVASALYVASNGWSGDVRFTLPSPGSGKTWRRVVDTCSWAEGPDQVARPGSEAPMGGEGSTYDLCGRGVLLLIAG